MPRPLTTALAAVLLLTVPENAAVTPSTAVARVWVTTPDRSRALTDQGRVPFTLSTPTALTITVDPSRTYQTMDGFGAALTDSSAAVLYRLGPAARDRAMAALFDPVAGIGLSYLRQPIGGSDFVTDRPYTYNDLAAGETDHDMRRFSIARDERRILPLLRQARRLNPDLRIMATPWSPPAWMKTNGSLVGGRLIDDPRIYRAYALYLVSFVQAYARAGVPVHALTVQNEPQNRTPRGYPGTDLPVAQQKKVIAALGPALRAAGLDTRILGFDHNWALHPDDLAATPPGQAPELDYAGDLLADPEVAPWISGIAYHCYYGDPAAQTSLRHRYPDHDVYLSECSGIESADRTRTFADTLRWHSRNLVIGATRHWAKTVLTWNLALDPGGGPHVGGCDTCTGLLTIGPGHQVRTNAEYHTLGHLSRFVRPGAARIASTSFGTTGWNGQVMDVAFRNPDGSTVLVAHNQHDEPRAFAVAVGTHSFPYTLPGGALATFTWPRTATLEQGLRPLLPVPAGAQAQPAGPTDPCCSGDVAAHAVDDDAGTRWSTGTGQRPGQYLQVDLGRCAAVDRLVLDTGSSVGDHPRGYQVSVSDDGARWSGPVAAGAGTGQLTDIPLAGRTARYLRVTLTATADNWWSVADVRAYGP